MSPLKRSGLAALIAGLALFGCSDPNAPAKIFNSETGKHAVGWTAGHGASYVTYQGLCHDCHGNRLDGGIANEGCFANMACHAGVTSCGTCHGNPPWGTQFPNTAGAHNLHLALNAGLACADCHNGSGSGTALHMNYAANVAFSAAVQTTFKANSGSIAYAPAALSCSKISCHGGIATPNWNTGFIDVNSQCRSCHTYGTSSQNPEYNSFWSGEHNKHVNGEGFSCTECHDTVKLAGVHFNDLHTTGMSEAYLTIKNALQYTGSAGATGSCTLQCHGKNHNPETW